MAEEKRGKGTFPGGVLKFSQETVRSLPWNLIPAELARLLGVSRAAVSKWMYREGLPSYPCDRREYGGSRMIVRSEFCEWAQKTGRYDGPVL